VLTGAEDAMARTNSAAYFLNREFQRHGPGSDSEESDHFGCFRMRAPEGDCVIEKLEVTFQINFKVAFRNANFQNIVFVVCILSWLVKSLFRL
jgi:hypothetical protein